MATWQERRSLPQNTSPRTNSPLPRRTTGGPALPTRPGVLPRTSSLSLASTPTGSTASLAATLRNPNASALRNELAPSPSPNVPSPLHILDNILEIDAGVDKHGASDISTEKRFPDLDAAIEFGGLSLKEYATRSAVDGSHGDVHSSSLNQAEFDREKSRYEELHKSIEACDLVLKSVETYLTGFQADLGAVSAEIESLQTRSTSLNSQLENRRVVEKLLGPAVEELSLSPDIVRKIADGPMDEAWIRALTELDKRSKIVHAKAKEQKKIKALDDLLPLIENLQNKAVERIRDYIVSQIKALRSPNINAQLIQQQGFLPFKDLYTFLYAQQPQLGAEICQAYVNTMRWYYLSQFTRYEAALRCIKLHHIEKNDLIGSPDDPSARRNVRGSPAAHDAYSIGRRMDIIKNPPLNALSAYVAEENKSPQYLEVVFRSFNVALVDNATFEYSFLSKFFSPAMNYHAITRTFDAIFSPTFKHGQELSKSLVDSSTDALGILMCVRLNQHFAFDFQRRKVPPGEGYINGTSMLLWPRFQMVMDMHCESLRKLSLSSQSTAPHPVTQRFASFLQGILELSSEAGDDEPVSRSLGRLSSDYEALITKISKSIGDARKRERFLFNNYSLVGTILEEAHGKLADERRQHFGELKRVFGDELR